MSAPLPRRGFLAAGGTALRGTYSAAPSASRPPNVVVFFTDQQRWDTLGVYGSPMGLTPNLDRMASHGTRFDRAFTTNPVCSPARSTIHTGKYPTATGVFRNGLTLKDDERTLGHYFKAQGYQTGFIGKWHLAGTKSEPVPLERRGGYDDWWTAADILEFTSTAYEGTVFDASNRPVRFSNRYRADALTDMAIEFLRRRQPNPFYLFISYVEPHHQNSANAFIAPRGYADRYRNNYYVPPDLAPYPGDWKSQLPHYYGIIARIDECFGRLMEELKAQSLVDNTVVAFTTDHGCHFRTRNTEYKRSCQDASIRIPLIIQGPGFDRGRVVTELVSLADLAPTLLDACGAPVAPTIQGRSLLRLARGQAESWPNEILVQQREAELGRVLRTEQWKYCVFDPENTNPNDARSMHYTERHLYDLRMDPHEHVNLIGRPDYRKIADELAERLRSRIRVTGEPEPKIETARYYA